MTSLSLDHSPFNVLEAEAATEEIEEAQARDDASEARAEAKADADEAAQAKAQPFLRHGTKCGRGSSMPTSPTKAAAAGPTAGVARKNSREGRQLALKLPPEDGPEDAGSRSERPRPPVVAHRRAKPVHRRVKSFGDVDDCLN